MLGSESNRNKETQKFIAGTIIQDEINKANMLSSATQQLISMHTSEVAQVNSFNNKLNSLLSSLQNASGLP